MEFYVSQAANIFDGKTVFIEKDIDLNGAEWTPIGDYAFSMNKDSVFTVVEYNEDEAHRADYDAEGTAYVLTKMIKKLEKYMNDPASYESIYEIGDE